MPPRRRKTQETEVTEMQEVTAVTYVEDSDWDGSVEELPAEAQPETDDVVTAPKRRGRAPLTLPTAAARFEKAKAAVARLGALDVEGERAKIQGQMERLTERLAKVDGHDQELKDAREELSAAEAVFNAALSAVQGN